jgi:predicted  nucleic acid-binding Zn-ribbon protein
MKEELIRLVTLQKYDRQIIEIESHLNNLQEQIKKDEVRLAKAKEQLSAKEQELQDRKVDSSRIDHDIQASEVRYKEYSYQLMNLKDTKSYDAMKSQLEELREEISQMESSGIDLLNEIEELEKTLAMYNEKIGAEETRIQEQKNLLEKDTQSRSEEKNELIKRSESYSAEISPEVMRTYKRLLKLPNGVALASVEGRTCTGCYSNITLENLEVVKMMSGLVSCNSCGRILYIPSLLGQED